MDIEALESTTFEAIVEKIQKVRKRGELLESIQGILKQNVPKALVLPHSGGSVLALLGSGFKPRS